MTAPEILAEWKALCDAATEGPWTSDHENCVFAGEMSKYFSTMVLECRGTGSGLSFEQQTANIDFAAAARTAMPRLIEALEYYERNLKHLSNIHGPEIDRILSGGTHEQH